MKRNYLETLIHGAAALLKLPGSLFAVKMGTSNPSSSKRSYVFGIDLNDDGNTDVQAKENRVIRQGPTRNRTKKETVIKRVKKELVIKRIKDIQSLKKMNNRMIIK